MCNPAAVQIAIAVVSTAMTAQQQRAQADFQEGTANFNARVAENEAQDARNAATEAENAQRQKTAELLARQRAQLGAANVDLNLGSALQLQEDTVTLGEADALRIRESGTSQVSALQSEASLLSSQAGFAASAGDAAVAGTLLSGASTVLNTGVADKWFSPNSSAITDAINDTAQIGL